MIPIPTTLDGNGGTELIRDPELCKSTAFTEVRTYGPRVVNIAVGITVLSPLLCVGTAVLMARLFGQTGI